MVTKIKLVQGTVDTILNSIGIEIDGIYFVAGKLAFQTKKQKDDTRAALDKLVDILKKGGAEVI